MSASRRASLGGREELATKSTKSIKCNSPAPLPNPNYPITVIRLTTRCPRLSSPQAPKNPPSQRNLIVSAVTTIEQIPIVAHIARQTVNHSYLSLHAYHSEACYQSAPNWPRCPPHTGRIQMLSTHRPTSILLHQLARPHERRACHSMTQTHEHIFQREEGCRLG